MPDNDVLPTTNTPSDIFKKLAAAENFIELRQITFNYHAAGHRFKGTSHKEVCSFLAERAVHFIQSADQLADAPAILQGMNKSRTNIGCGPLSENAGEHGSDQSDIHRALMSKALENISDAPSGCMVDMTLRSLHQSISYIGAKLSDDEKLLLQDAIRKRTNEAVSQTDLADFNRANWQEWEPSNLRKAGYHALVQASPACAA